MIQGIIGFGLGLAFATILLMWAEKKDQEKAKASQAPVYFCSYKWGNQHEMVSGPLLLTVPETNKTLMDDFLYCHNEGVRHGTNCAMIVFTPIIPRK